MAGGAHDDATMRRYSEAHGAARARRRLGLARPRTTAVVRGLGFSDDDLDRPLATFSGGELTRASLGRALAGDPDLLLLDEPTNHLDVGQPRVARDELTHARRGGHPRRARPLVPRGGDDGGARARGRPRAVLRRPVARVAAREGGPRAGGGQGGTALRRRHRPARALRRAVPLQEVEGEAGPGEADPDRAAVEGAGEDRRRAGCPHAARPLARLRVPRAAAERHAPSSR